MALVFDTREYLDALEPPVFRHGGRETVGGFVSWDEYQRFELRLSEWKQDGGRNVRLLTRIMRDYLDAIFPPPPKPHWWSPRQPSVWDEVRRLPFAVQIEAFRSFMRSQATAHTPKPEHESGHGSAQPAPPPPLGMAPPSASGTEGGGESDAVPSPT